MRAKIILLLLASIGLALPSTIKWITPYLEERLPFEFSLDKIALDRKTEFQNVCQFDPKWVENQEFQYIGHGGQAVAFANEKYVLKFFLIKQLLGEKKYRIPKPTHWIPHHRKERQKKRALARERSLKKAMKNYEIAFEKLKEKTGILAIHFNANEDPLPPITIVDHLGKKYAIDLGRASFILQHKAMLVPQKLAMAKNKEEKEALIASLHNFFAQRAKAGFFDTERSFMINDNYGFLGDTPIQLDVGNIAFKETIQMSPETEIVRMQTLLSDWAQNL